MAYWCEPDREAYEEAGVRYRVTRRGTRAKPLVAVDLAAVSPRATFEYYCAPARCHRPTGETVSCTRDTTVECDVAGQEIHAGVACTIEGLMPGTSHLAVRPVAPADVLARLGRRGRPEVRPVVVVHDVRLPGVVAFGRVICLLV